VDLTRQFSIWLRLGAGAGERLPPGRGRRGGSLRGGMVRAAKPCRPDGVSRLAARHGPTPGVPRAAQKDAADRAALGSRGFAMRGGAGRPPPGAAPVIGDRRWRRSPGCPASYRSQRRCSLSTTARIRTFGLSQPASGDGQQPPACRPFKAEGEDAVKPEAASRSIGMLRTVIGGDHRLAG
jgi:hypothetical protein